MKTNKDRNILKNTECELQSVKGLCVRRGDKYIRVMLIFQKLGPMNHRSGKSGNPVFRV
ncbi:MAG: hypothetical protein QM743_10285 [Chitinophagaceae bacterium]